MSRELLRYREKPAISLRRKSLNFHWSISHVLWRSKQGVLSHQNCCCRQLSAQLFLITEMCISPRALEAFMTKFTQDFLCVRLLRGQISEQIETSRKRKESGRNIDKLQSHLTPFLALQAPAAVSLMFWVDSSFLPLTFLCESHASCSAYVATICVCFGALVSRRILHER